MESYLEPEKISLLWPEGESSGDTSILINRKQVVSDLGFERIIETMASDFRRVISLDALKVDAILNQITDDPRVIDYRLEVVEDLLNYPEFTESLRKLVPLIDGLADIRQRNVYNFEEGSRLRELVGRISELEIYVESIRRLETAFGRCKELDSEALLKLKEQVEKVLGDAVFCSLESDLPEIKEKFRELKSVTLGINLDEYLHPEEVVMLAVDDRPHRGGSLIGRLRDMAADDGRLRGLSPLEAVKGRRLDRKSRALNQAILDALERHLRSAIRSCGPQVERYAEFSAEFLFTLGGELLFYLGAYDLICRMRELGLPMCRPRVLAREERSAEIKEIYNINLAFQLAEDETEQEAADVVVTNDICFDDQGRIFVLTGPNQGGKTTFTQAVGQAQLLFQLGLFVPGERAQISPADMFFTHFPVEEEYTSGMGRMAEECTRLKEIVGRATDRSLVLMNESLASTSPQEAVAIARGLIIGLGLMEVRAIFATHFHALGKNLEEINELIEGSNPVASLVAGVEKRQAEDGELTARRSYRIQPSPPPGVSHAQEIASMFGVDIERILKTLRERRIVDNGIAAEEVYRRLEE